MKSLFIIKNGKKIEITAMKFRGDAMDGVSRKYDTCYEATDLEGNAFKVYEHKGYCSFGYRYEAV